MKYQKGYVKKGDKLSPSRRKIISLHNARYWLGKKRSKDMIERISKKLKGRILGPSKIVPRMNIFCKYCGNKFLVRITDYKRDKVEFCKKKCYSKWQEKNTCGTASPAWKGSVSKNILLRMRKKYKRWRDKVFKRDKYTCQNHDVHFGKMIGTVHLNAHHKKSFAKNPRLRYKVSNGITLCRKCHSKIHNGRNVK